MAPPGLGVTVMMGQQAGQHLGVQAGFGLRPAGGGHQGQAHRQGDALRQAAGGIPVAGWPETAAP